MHTSKLVVIILLVIALAVVGCTTAPVVTDPAAEAEEERRLEEERVAEELRLLEAAEAQRREEMGDLYVPSPPAVLPDNPPVQAKGLYVTGNIAGIPARFNALLDLIDSSVLNAMVIDVKDDHGLMTYRSAVPVVEAAGANRYERIKDISGLLRELREKEVYTIARIVAFKDHNLSQHRPDLSIQRRDGKGVWYDSKGVSWVNPFDKQVWDYNIAIAKEAALLGFREIQFDYVRFPDNAKKLNAVATFPNRDERTKAEAITAFLAYAREELRPYGAYVSADVFGVIATSPGDSDDIGQVWEDIAVVTDYICPMIYPSHYGPGYFGFAVPDAHPYGTVREAMTDALERQAPLTEPAIIRPWIQDFNATWVDGYIRYGAAEIREQVRAMEELGITEYLLWNPNNRYTEGAWRE